LTKTRWKVRVGVEAEKDFVRILKYTADTFGERQASIYKAKLTDAIAALGSGPDARQEASLASKSYPISAASTSHVTAEEGDISSCIAPQWDSAVSMTPWIWPDTFRQKPRPSA
jgi:plasmid stabilization system protein ParE